MYGSGRGLGFISGAGGLGAGLALTGFRMVGLVLVGLALALLGLVLVCLGPFARGHDRRRQLYRLRADADHQQDRRRPTPVGAVAAAGAVTTVDPVTTVEASWSGDEPRNTSRTTDGRVRG